MNLINDDEYKEWMKRYERLTAEATDPAAVRAQMTLELEAEAQHRRRVALLVESVRKQTDDITGGYRNHKGKADKIEAWMMRHEDFGYRGTFVMDAVNLHDRLFGEAIAEIQLALKEFKRGAITGDRRRQGAVVGNSKVGVRMENFVREVHGISTGDEKAKAMATAWLAVAERLRVDFNTAGGAIGKLDGGYLPQHHSRDALIDVGMKKWVEYLMTDGVLDRSRMVHPLTNKPLGNADLKEALEVAWRRIVTDGMIDAEIDEGKFGTKPALYKQHADHRFIHFKDADAWLKYAKLYGSPDVFATMVGHIHTMTRDIAHMRIFSPRPEEFRRYYTAKLRKDAAMLEPMSIIWRDKTDEMHEVFAEMSKLSKAMDPIKDDRAKLAELDKKIYDIVKELEQAKSFYAVTLSARKRDTKDATYKQWSDQLHAASEERRLLAKKINDHFNGHGNRLSDEWFEFNGRPEMIELRRRLDSLEDDLYGGLDQPPSLVDDMSPRRARNYLNRKIRRVDDMWRSMRGNVPVDEALARIGQGTRSLVSAASLSGAVLSAVTDAAFGAGERRRLGIAIAQSNVWRSLLDTLKEFATMGNRDDFVAAEMGLDAVRSIMHQQAREVKKVDFVAWTGYVNDRSLTLGGLLPWTQGGKVGFSIAAMRFFAEMAGKPFVELDKLTQKVLRTHGIDAAGWEQIRTAPLHTPEGGVGILRAREIKGHAGEELANRYGIMLQREMRYAVPETTYESRSVILGNTAPGTPSGELIRSMAQFKGYGLAIVLLHWRRIARELGAGDRNGLRHAGALLLSSIMLGAVAMALKDMKEGRDPRRMLDEKTWLDPRFWGAAALQSGGFGIYGDLLFSEVNRHGGNLQKTIAGPLADRVSTAGSIVAMPFEKMAGKKVNPGREGLQALRQWTPGLSAPFVGLVLQRVLFDQLQKAVDPEAYTAFRQDMVKRKNDFGQDYWWPRGEAAPKRAPDLTRIFATR